MSLVKICVPSKARADLFHKKTFQILKNCRLPWSVFVEPQDYHEYAQFVPVSKLVKLDKNDEGLGFSLNSIRKHCEKRGFTYCWKLDDDIHHVYTASRVAPKDEQGLALSRVVDEVLLPAHQALKEKLGGISFPNKLFHTDWSKFTHINKMFESLYIVRTVAWFTPIKAKGYNEEPFASAFLINEGLITLRTGMLAWNLDMSTASGGLQCFDRSKEHEERFKWMQKTYPAIMRLMKPAEYKQKSGVTFTVVDKKDYNRRHSSKLPIKKNAGGSPEIVTVLNQLWKKGHKCDASLSRLKK